MSSAWAMGALNHIHFNNNYLTRDLVIGHSHTLSYYNFLLNIHHVFIVAIKYQAALDAQIVIIRETRRKKYERNTL